MKVAALDTGDVWTGIALSDALKMLAKPYKTISSGELYTYIPTLLAAEKIDTIVIGYPKTMRGTESEQTKKIVALKEQLATRFPQVKWILWDERLSSKRADALKRAKTKEEKIQSHSVAAAFILQSYLGYLHIQENS